MLSYLMTLLISSLRGPLRRPRAGYCWGGAVLACCFVVAGTSPATAQEQDRKAEARREFDRGVTAFNERRFDEAAAAFEAAYQLSPAYSVLYNVGQVSVALGRPVKAVESYELYLEQGGASIAPARRAEVEAELERQRARIGSLRFEVEPAGATILVDGKRVGQSPLEDPVKVAVGTHTIVVTLEGYTTTTRDIEVAPRSQLVLGLVLDPLKRAEPPPAAPPPAPAPPARPTLAAPAPVAPPAAMATPSPTPVDAGPRPGATPRVLGFVVGGVGLVAVGTGAVLALMSVENGDDAMTDMKVAADAEDVIAYDNARADYEEALDLNEVGWWVLGGGGGALLVGTIIVATAPRTRQRTGWRVDPWIAARGGGANVRTRW